MKNLQNNFTTPEQSKRLLELGVPVWTADGQYNDFNGNILVLPDWSVFSPIYENNTRKPCWSVGRLIEILETCWTDRIESPIWYNYPGKGRTIIERVLWDFDNRKLDFSELF